MLWKSIAEIIMDEVDSYIYVADYETSELIYMNSLARKRYGKDDEDMSFLGKKCYEVIQNKNELCSFCKRSILNEKNFCHWHNYNEFQNMRFFNRDKIIKIDGRLYHIQISTIDERGMEEKRKLEQQLEIERKLVKCARTFASDLPVNEAIQELLHILAVFFNADRAYIFEINHEKQLTSNTYEWTTEGVSSEIDRLQNLPVSLIENWLEIFHTKGAFYISSLDEDVDIESDTYEILQAQGIDSLMAVPLMERGKISGFLGVDNPRKNYDDFTLLTSVTYFLQNDLEKRKVYGKLARMSFEDTMTGLYNRNKYNQSLSDFTENVPDSLGIFYMDLNGLKKLNDEQGHELGDQLLRDTGNILKKLFEKKAYRVGGDEFVIILPNVCKEEFMAKLDSLRETMKENKIDISVGESWRDENVDISAQIHKADKLMYIEKMRHHEMQQY